MPVNHFLNELTIWAVTANYHLDIRIILENEREHLRHTAVGGSDVRTQTSISNTVPFRYTSRLMIIIRICHSKNEPRGCISSAALALY